MIADLEVVRPGDIRGRRSPLHRGGVVIRKGVSVRIVETAIAEVRQSIDGRLLGDRNQVGEPIGRHLAIAREPVLEPRDPRVQEHPVRHGRPPGCLRHVIRQVVVTRKRLRRVGGVPNSRSSPHSVSGFPSRCPSAWSPDSHTDSPGRTKPGCAASPGGSTGSRRCRSVRRYASRCRSSRA